MSMKQTPPLIYQEPGYTGDEETDDWDDPAFDITLEEEREGAPKRDTVFGNI